MVFPAGAPVRYNSFNDDETSTQHSTTDQTPLASPAVMNGTDPGLPPTPPTNSLEASAHVDFATPVPVDNAASSNLTKKPSISTPVNQWSPPTPDPSPPRTSESLAPPERPPFNNYPSSSRAESFRTAKEDQSDGESSRRQMALNDSPVNGYLNATRSLRLRTLGLGLEFDQSDGDATPTERGRSAPQSGKKDSELDTAWHYRPSDTENIPNREWDTNLMRNVTVRRKRPLRASPQHKASNHEDTSPEAAMPASPSVRDKAKERDLHSASFEKFADDIGWPAEVNRVLSLHLRDKDSKRLSSVSTTSTVVEAVVVDSPPQRLPTLRHAKKNLALRSDAESPVERSSTVRSNRNSLNSDDVPLHRLVHKKPRIPDRRNRNSVGSDIAASETSSVPAVPLRHHRQSIQVGVLLSGPSEVFSVAVYDNKAQLDMLTLLSQSRSTIASDSPSSFFDSSPKRITTNPLTPSSPTTLNRERRNFTEPGPYRSHVDPAPLASRSRHYVRQPSPPPPDTQEKSVLYDASPIAPQQYPAHIEQPKPAPQEARPELAAVPVEQRSSIDHRENDRPRVSFDHTASDHGRPSITSLDRVPTEELHRPSAELSPSFRRISLDRSTVRTEEHAMARHVYTSSTPFSQISDLHDLEVSEATAVSIFPHNNHSLLVVQQVAKPSSASVSNSNSTSLSRHNAHYPSSHPSTELIGRTEPSGQQLLDGPLLTIEPSTPPDRNTEIFAVDSPLKNPRKPPPPPAFKIIPPTPADELDRQLAAPLPPSRDRSCSPNRTVSGPPVARRLSVLQRARRYSDTFIAPLLSRNGSLSDRWSAVTASGSRNGKTVRRVPSVGDEGQDPRDNKLHPFWRPRGFWDDFSDDDSDDDFFDEGRADLNGEGAAAGGARDRLPEGGDTSSVPSLAEEGDVPRLKRVGRRLTDGFKGSGGFLIGNSLGIERGPTNRRRHYVSLPLGVSGSGRARGFGTGGRGEPAGRVVKGRVPDPADGESDGLACGRGWWAEESEGGHGDTGYRSADREQGKREWRLPGTDRRLQYIGLGGLKGMMKEKKAEKRREELRRSIGRRWMLEGPKIG
ncbi:hypothetical protein H2199_008052 [Coniosporium tulheliwenetii]|uniref:Uncharacterized protein n=1 Tax=Coniosporium tulheliwenetii TaxID=3383036 RepID=A0ACC2YM67_9PEZI|nr:hypothetical protein H2199_008052 [Cladosporium sp. JES 115]